MIAADHDRRLQLARRHHLVEGEAEPVPVAEPDPADARRQALETDALARHVEPVVQMPVVRHQLLHLGVGPIDVLGIARQRRPAERADRRGRTAGGYRPARSRESRTRRRRLPPSPSGGCCCRSRRRNAACDGSRASRAHASPSRRARRARPPWDRARAAPPIRASVQPARQIAVDRIVRGGLVGHDVGPHAAAHAVRERCRRRCRAGRPRPACRSRLRLVDDRQRLVEVAAAWRRDSRCAGASRCGSAGIRRRDTRRPPWSPRAAARRPCRRGPPSESSARRDRRRNAGGRFRRRSRRCPARCPGCRCRSTSPPSSGRTSSGPCDRAR